MSNFFIGADNLIDRTFYGATVFTGGSWETALPLNNLKDRFLVNVCQSSNALAASTKFYFDLRVLRGIRHTFIPTHNCERNATYRIRYSDIAQFSDCVVNANTSLGASSIVFRASTAGAVITTGDYFSVEGNTQVYKATNTITISASGTGTVNITPNLVADAAINSDIECHTGNFSSPTRDSGTTDVYPAVFNTLELSWLDPHQWDGRYTDEELTRIKQPIVDYSSTPFFARYGLIEIVDTANSAGYIWLSRLFVSLGYQPSINPIYGMRQGFSSTTKINNTLGDAEFFEVRGKRRTFTFDLNEIQTDEALSNTYEIIDFSGVDKQVVFSFNPDDTIHLPRRTMLARFQTLPDLSYAYFDRINTPHSLIEVIA